MLITISSLSDIKNHDVLVYVYSLLKYKLEIKFLYGM